MKPKLFIASSTSGLSIARALQAGLEREAEATVWDQNVFAPSEFILEGLVKRLDRSEFGAFVFTPDDVLQIKGDEKSVARDNVLFELGLFIGRVGRERSTIVKPREADLYLPSDLLGITVAEFESNRSDGNLEAALGPVCFRIRQIFDKYGAGPPMPRELLLKIVERVNVLSNRQRDLLKFFAAAEARSEKELQVKFPNVLPSELFYRIEQLRLLRFIDVRDINGEKSFCISAIYKAASGTSIGQIDTGFE